MILRYLAYVWLAFTGLVYADQLQYITVTGSGDTFQQAKETAFRKAIEFKVGLTVVSDVDIKNYKIAKEEIYLYSAGYIDDYKVLSQENSPQGVTVLLSVAVAESKLKNRILSVGKDTATFGGNRHATQVSTYLQERQQGDRLFDRILEDYPVKAYKIKQSTYAIEFDRQRKPFIKIPYELSWNFEYIKSLRETLDLINDCTPQWSSACNYKIIIMAKDPKDYVFGKTTNNYFNDVVRNNQLHNRFVYGSPVIIVKLYDLNNNVFDSVCYTPRFVWGGNEGFYSTGRENVAVISGNTTEKGTIDITAPLSTIDRTAKIELVVESKDRCQTQKDK